MLVVLASRHDCSCQGFVAGLAADAGLLTCQDLSARGWRYEPGGQVRTLVVGGRPIPGHEVDGVLTRLPSVDENELAGIVPADRSYVAAEMTAFLTAWLSDLRCPVLNRPAPLCLMGPYLRKEQWVQMAARLGIPVMPARRSVPGVIDNRLHDLPPGSATIDVVGGLCVGRAAHSLRASALALAKAAGVGLLRTAFAAPEAGSAFLGADYWVDISDPRISQAVVRYFTDGRGR
jgi:hypothetical protein